MKFIGLLILASSLAVPSVCPAQNLAGIKSGDPPPRVATSPVRADEIVVKIGSARIDPKESLKHLGLAIDTSNGTGWCLGRDRCDLILTNYHVAERSKSPLKIKGIRVLQTYEGTSPQDNDAVWEKAAAGFSIKLVPVRDIAIFRLEYPLRKMHGIPFSAQELSKGENVKIYGNPGGKKLTVASATFYAEAKDGILFFKVKPEDEKILIPGISGSLVVNEQNEAVGLVQGFADGNMAAVVPVWSLADFVKKVLLYRYQEIFPFSDQAIYRPDMLVPVDKAAQSAALASDIGPEDGLSPPPALPEEYLWYDLDKATSPVASGTFSSHVRIQEPPNVQALRKKAEGMVERISDLIAVGRERSMGGRSPEVAMQYRLRMLSGQQTFTMGDKELQALPCPKEIGIDLGIEWSDLPTMVGSNLKLRIEEVGDLVLRGWGSVMVFRYEGSPEDKVVQVTYCSDYGFHIHTKKTISVAVRGEVWTDDGLNILRITEELLVPPAMGWINEHSSVLYGWLESPKGERSLVPTNIFRRAEFTEDHQIYSTLCRITDYHRFAVSVVVGGELARPIN